MDTYVFEATLANERIVSGEISQGCSSISEVLETLGRVYQEAEKITVRRVKGNGRLQLVK